MSKTCETCFHKLSWDEFQTYGNDRHLNTCKECQKWRRNHWLELCNGCNNIKPLLSFPISNTINCINCLGWGVGK